jgi:hypothetical protein
MRAVLVGLILCSLVGCKKKEATTETSTTKTTEATGSGSTTTTTTTTTTGSAAAPAATAAPTNGAPVDVCAAIPKDKVEAAVGKVTGDPTKDEARGSLLGQCSWMTESGMAIVSARPASEYAGTVSAYKGTDLPGVGEKAATTNDVGVMVKPAGTAYFVQVMVMGTDGKLNADKSKALAKVAADNLK